MTLASELKVSLKTFCRDNNLDLKVCNKKYKVYRKLYGCTLAPAEEMDGNNEISTGIKVEELKNTYEIPQEKRHSE